MFNHNFIFIQSVTDFFKTVFLYECANVVMLFVKLEEFGHQWAVVGQDQSSGAADRVAGANHPILF